MSFHYKCWWTLNTLRWMTREITGEKVLAPVSALPLSHCLPGKLPGIRKYWINVTIVKLAHELTVETLRQISNLECLFASVQACNHGHLIFTVSLSRGLTPRYFCFSKPSLYNKDASQWGDTFFFLAKILCLSASHIVSAVCPVSAILWGKLSA